MRRKFEFDRDEYRLEVLRRQYGENVNDDLAIVDALRGEFKKQADRLPDDLREWMDKFLEVARFEVGRKVALSELEKVREKIRKLNDDMARQPLELHERDKVRRRVKRLERFLEVVTFQRKAERPWFPGPPEML